VRFSSREPFGSHAEALELWVYVPREGWEAALGDVGIAQNETAFTTARDLCDPATLKPAAAAEPAPEGRARGKKEKGGGGDGGGGGGGKRRRRGGGKRRLRWTAVAAAAA